VISLSFFECLKCTLLRNLHNLSLVEDNLSLNLLDNHGLSGNLMPFGWNVINASNKPFLFLKVVFLKPTLENTFGYLRIEVANGWLWGGPLYSSWTASSGSLWVRKRFKCTWIYGGLFSWSSKGDKGTEVGFVSPSRVNEHTLSWPMRQEQNMFFLCSSSSPWKPFETLSKRSISPLSTFTSTSSSVSS